MMKNILFLLAFALLWGCSEDNDDKSTLAHTDFCTQNRTLDAELDHEEGTLVYLEGKDKFAIEYYPVLPTIDEVTYYILCEKPAGTETDSPVVFSGKSYKFNENEGFDPSVGGASFYFFEPTSIAQD